MNLKHITDSVLITETRSLVAEERRVSAKLLHYFKEIEHRRLFSEYGCGSLFDFMVKELKYTEGAASRRIKAARLLKVHPEVEKKIESGHLSFTNVAMACDLFRNEQITDIQKQRAILKELEGKSKIQSEMIVRSHMKEPPQEKHLISVGRTTMLKIDKVTGLLGKYSQEEVIAYAMDLTASELEKRKFAIVERVRKVTNVTGRTIPASVKRTVYSRDRVCTKCGSSFRLEFDHIKPYSMGGESSVENIRLLCRSCNQRNRITQFNQR